MKVRWITAGVVLAGLCFYAVVVQSPQVYYGKASWYSRWSPGVRERTADNERFNDKAMTAAMWDVPFGTLVRVTDINTGRSVVVRINDRGPHKRYVARGRIIDLTKAAFGKISPRARGVVPVKVEVLGLE